MMILKISFIKAIYSYKNVFVVVYLIMYVTSFKHKKKSKNLEIILIVVWSLVRACLVISEVS